MIRRALPILAAAACLGTAGCGEKEEEAFREGLFEEAGGLTYNVYITRQLNPRIQPDRDYYSGPEAAPGNALYGVFLKVCNEGDETRRAAREFKIRDSTGDDHEPVSLPPDNVFAYQPRALAPGECIPSEGSAADSGVTAGAMLLFDLPLAATEARPLELEVKPPFDAFAGERHPLAIELDI